MTGTPLRTTNPAVMIALSALIESPWNPRKTFETASQASLAESMKRHGQLMPLLARPQGEKFELATGHRRYRAAKALGLTHLEVKVREMDDSEFCAILTIENDEREDVHPLEQAEGYKLLMEKGRNAAGLAYTVADIAEKVQRSHDYVYDRLALLNLIPSLKTLFKGGRFQLTHAVILAKLSEAEQTKVSTKDGGLWRRSQPTLGDEHTFPLVAVTPAELQYWIATNLRFDETQVVLEELLPETAVLIDSALETGTRMISITRENHVSQNAKDPKDKVYTAKFWKRADGEEGSKPCDYVVLGIFRTGEGRGTGIGVCIRRDACKIHWRAEVLAAEQRVAAKKAPSAKLPAAEAKEATARARELAAAKRKELEENLETSRAHVAAEAIKAQLKAIALKPTAAQVKYAREVLGGSSAVSIETLLVSLAMEQQIRGNLRWALTNDHEKTNTRKKLRNWGIDAVKVMATVEVETCIHCGCSEQNACRGPHGMGPNCKWVSTDPRVCSNPACVAAQAAAEKAPEAAPPPKRKKDEPHMEPLQPSAALAAIVGKEPINRMEVTKRVWVYIKKHNLQDKKSKRLINADATLGAVIGNGVVNMFAMTPKIARHLTPIARTGK